MLQQARLEGMAFGRRSFARPALADPCSSSSPRHASLGPVEDGCRRSRCLTRRTNARIPRNARRMHCSVCTPPRAPGQERGEQGSRASLAGGQGGWTPTASGGGGGPCGSAARCSRWLWSVTGSSPCRMAEGAPEESPNDSGRMKRGGGPPPRKCERKSTSSIRRRCPRPRKRWHPNRESRPAEP
jgi:hypothetical protein